MVPQARVLYPFSASPSSSLSPGYKTVRWAAGIGRVAWSKPLPSRVSPKSHPKISHRRSNRRWDRALGNMDPICPELNCHARSDCWSREQHGDASYP